MTVVENAVRSRGRPRSFDCDVVLERAAGLFARVGYEGASIADLTTAMGITAQSLYAAFGSKEALYRKALDWFVRGDGGAAALILEQEPDAIAAVAEMFDDAANRFTAGSSRGCMIASGALACAQDHAALAEHLAELRCRSQAGIEARLARGVAEDQLARDTDVAGLARFVAAITQGMSVQARDGTGKTELAAIGRLAVEALERARSPKVRA